MNKQQEVFNRFKKLKVGALFMKMGSGKTKVAIDLVNNVEDKIDLALFIVPNQTIKTLEYEIIKWGLDVPYLIKSYENISQSDKGYLDTLKIIKDKRLFIVADESSFIKNETSKRYERILEIAKYSEFRLILNGTPITKDEWDLYNQMYFLSPKIIGMSRNEFLNTFFKKITFKKAGEKEKTFYKLSEINIDYLQKLIDPYVFKSDLDFSLKESINNKIIISSSKTQEAYLKQKEILLKNIKEGYNNILLDLVKLEYINACDKNKAREIAGYIKNKQVICYCHYLKELDLIKTNLNNNCYVITGGIKNRNKIIESFKNNNKPLLITYGCGAFGLNLQFCNEIVFSSLIYDYSKLEQAKYRIKRIGQTKDIIYTTYKTELGINKLIDKCINNKTTLDKLIKEYNRREEKQWLKNI